MREWIRTHSWEVLLAGILLVTIVVNISLSSAYLGVDNFVNLFQLSIEKAIVAVVMAFIIINGEIDLSVASVMAFAACVLAGLQDQGSVPFALAVVVALAAAAAAGFVQGVFVAKLGLPSLVVTLAGLIGFRGAARILLEDRSIGGFPGWFDHLGQRALLGPVPFALLLFLVELVVAGVILHRTAFGRSVYVIGNNADVARYSGIDVARVKLALFTTSGLVAGVAGVLFAARLGSVRGDLAEGFELDIITMVLLGGVSIFGGSGSILGVALAIFVVLNIRNGLGLANVEANTQTGIVGALLIVSVLVPNLVARFHQRRPPPDHEPGAPRAPAELDTASRR